MVVRADGTGMHTAHRAGALAKPAWSPDARWIAHDYIGAGPRIVPSSGGRIRRLALPIDYWAVEHIQWRLTNAQSSLG